MCRSLHRAASNDIWTVRSHPGIPSTEAIQPETSPGRSGSPLRTAPAPSLFPRYGEEGHRNPRLSTSFAFHNLHYYRSIFPPFFPLFFSSSLSPAGGS
ncbi:hypothetical protein LOK49_LG01G03062 [Camellia lanceoleosa]|uniref:Uncharacterized protein n=1 Tax=Camellia lanceoleosa TaxID=1840588 RepID=A0ACC0IYV9_9ERIC|nr:hypothetical protein LOK49_LG01G03062 [Camellia lanceoleosa]